MLFSDWANRFMFNKDLYSEGASLREFLTLKRFLSDFWAFMMANFAVKTFWQA